MAPESGFSCVKRYVEREPEGTPAHWDSYSFAEPFAGSNAAGVAVCILLKLGLDRIGAG